MLANNGGGDANEFVELVNDGGANLLVNHGVNGELIDGGGWNSCALNYSNKRRKDKRNKSEIRGGDWRVRMKLEKIHLHS